MGEKKELFTSNLIMSVYFDCSFYDTAKCPGFVLVVKEKALAETEEH